VWTALAALPLEEAKKVFTFSSFELKDGSAVRVDYVSQDFLVGLMEQGVIKSKAGVGKHTGDLLVKGGSADHWPRR
jgi:hypothetical protein